MSYSPPLAATLSGATIRQLAYWRRPTTSGAPALLVPQYGTKPRVHYSYADIVALRMFVRLREQISLQRIRRAVAWMLETHPETHMSAHALQAVPGEQTIVWISAEGDYFDVVNHPGETGFQVVMESIFRSFQTESGRVVPDLGEPSEGVTVDPEIRGGYPVIENTRIPYSLIAGLVRDGVSTRDIRALYPRVRVKSIEGAADFARLVERASAPPDAA